MLLTPCTPVLVTAIQPWFEHPEVQRRLGGPQWPARAFVLQVHPSGDEPFRGRRVLRTHGWILLDGDAPVAYLGGEVYDRWTVVRPDADSELRVIEAEDVRAFGQSYVVDPARWGRGYGRAVLTAAIVHRDMADVELFALGVDSDNVASARCAVSAGYACKNSEPDWEDMVFYTLRRDR